MKLIELTHLESSNLLIKESLGLELLKLSNGVGKRRRGRVLLAPFFYITVSSLYILAIAECLAYVGPICVLAVVVTTRNLSRNFPKNSSLLQVPVSLTGLPNLGRHCMCDGGGEFHGVSEFRQVHYLAP